MKIKYLNKTGLSFYDGKILIYKKYIKHTNKHKDFGNLMKEISHEHKVKFTDIMSNSICLWYKKNGNDEIFISENNIVDKVKLSQNKNESFNLVRKIIV